MIFSIFVESLDAMRPIDFNYQILYYIYTVYIKFCHISDFIVQLDTTLKPTLFDIKI